MFEISGKKKMNSGVVFSIWMLKHGLMGKFLTPDEREGLKKQLRLEKIGRRMDRIRVVLALDEGWAHKTIAKILVLDEGTVSNHRKRYEERGPGASSATTIRAGSRSCPPGS